MSNVEGPLVQRRPMTLLMLPEDMVHNCLSRISRLYYSSLSLVSKKFGSLLASPDLYISRSLLDRTEGCLYVYLQLCTDSNQQRWCWFTLCHKPNSSSKILVPVSSPNSPFECKSSVVAVDSSIYVIGCEVNDNASSRVMVMDCHSHICSETTSMQVARLSPSVCVADGKIYVTGGCESGDSTNLIEVFDTKTKFWEFLQIPSEEIREASKYKTMGYEGTIHVGFGREKGKWRKTDLELDSSWEFSPHCVIDNVLYYFRGIMIYWYDSNDKRWRDVKGLPRTFMSFPCRCGWRTLRLVGYGRNMVALWEECTIINHHAKKTIRCAEISLERRQEKEIWGTIKWCDIVLVTNKDDRLVDAVAVTL